MTQTHSFCDMKKQKTDKTGLWVDKKNRLAFQKKTLTCSFFSMFSDPFGITNQKYNYLIFRYLYFLKNIFVYVFV